ncbi:thioredoxin family protein [Stenotrophomonas rhizophila]|uniref:thioredoxin family protein n=1 Tax=Stenotrophomonas rhizophila TaxID=216778 RepID=UPI001E538796|nr:thioredoxin family protein [Stenotrophomonas rhizophila]MCC7633964.1 thioredoxin family protein [Stenotrophomonas rhizophila]MCC7663298.1 thioredoxin family protein [Stenotrophomonas rhizophila]
MAYTPDYVDTPPSRAELDAGSGWQLLEFGAPWCPHCSAAQPVVQALLQQHDMPHLKVEDGKGRLLGRAYQVKLWPTVILLHNGEEQGRVVRPLRVEDIEALAALVRRQDA